MTTCVINSLCGYEDRSLEALHQYPSLGPADLQATGKGKLCGYEDRDNDDIPLQYPDCSQDLTVWEFGLVSAFASAGPKLQWADYLTRRHQQQSNQGKK